MKCSAATLVLSLFASTSALAQESAVKTAADAFGERVGIEQLGLYSEGQVRGFDLQASGAYRIDDAYFARASPLNDTVLGGVSVRVGVNASRLAYPAPSGVVNYRLRSPSPENRLTIGGGRRDFGTTVVQAEGSWTAPSKDAWIAGGTFYRPNVTWGSGGNGEALDIGAVAGWTPVENHSLRVFATWYGRDYDGDFAIQAQDSATPPPVKALRQHSPTWANVRAENVNLGALYKGEISGWTLDASAFRSIYSMDSSDFTVIATRRNGDATSTTFVSPGRTNLSDSYEARATRVFDSGAIDHLVSASVRYRHSAVDLAQSLAVANGAFNLRDPAPSAPARPAWRGARGDDTVDQLTASLGYGLVWEDRLQLRLGAHRSRYEKEVRAYDGSIDQGENQAWYYNASAVWSLTASTSLFASYVTGLEESGFAPQNATNRNEVLPPVKAKQKEIGVRHTFGDNLTLLAAAFEVSKPTTGFRSDGSFGLVGEVSHKGFEASLAGRVGEKTSIVLGAVSYDAEITGPLVTSGVVGPHHSGIAELIANASIERQITSTWSVDAQVNHQGEAYADSRNTFKAPALTTLGLGARARFDVAGRPAQLRLLVSNLTDERGYFASTSDLLWPIAPRTARAILTVTFGG
ncbi:TonB-dependent receptor [Phenylobacterium sp.]|uniref:TonB-dependent receptor n=1 Tax=Phenylobacterium sp. TaxID=1871053 RepID=UPI00286D012F|nr:TonB-dependent receptor [Phenylobacterium sp.]